MADYSLVDRLLHHVACGLRPVSEMSFDIEQARFADQTQETLGDHVFICGLARAGTTILMRNLFATEAFCSLTYRDMPFVLAPNTWHNFARYGRRDVEKQERAHKDGIEVDVDSPEALDEVFWRVFAGESYISDAGLSPMLVDEDLLEKYKRYVSLILLRYNTNRYLSKGNNNILRIDALERAFPKAAILLPFRDPYSQALSLHRQHTLMLKLNKSDPFSAKYMKWLAHHEFGANHRPFLLGEEPITGSPETLDYWLNRWSDTYQFILKKLETSGNHLVPVCYETLCTDPNEFRRICSRISVPYEGIDTFDLVKHARDDAMPFKPSILERAESIYQDLNNRALARH